jgi:hypothetical protein
MIAPRPEVPAFHAIGRHLLGRNRHPGDTRDYSMSDYLGLVPDKDFSPFLDQPLGLLVDNHEFIGVWDDILAFWRWLKGQHSPTPPPTPPPGPIQEWTLASQLDQGQTGHCVGFGSTAWRNATPVPNSLQNADAHDFYYACKVLDGEPRAETGSYVHTAAKLLLSRKEIGAYVWAKNMDDLVNWVAHKSPVVAGTDWDENMFSPDPSGYVAPGGGVAGGHCYLYLDFLPDEDAFLCDNSWGTGWSLGGRFKIKVKDVATLMGRAGAEFMAGIEIPVS